jgi:branched-chain amino acid transport system ATP-binding protein
MSREKAQALECVSIHVHEREFVSVVGLNGAGKTTLFNAISGLVLYAAEIAWGGASLKGRSGAAIAPGGIVHCAETRELFGDMTVRENLDSAASTSRSKRRGSSATGCSTYS